jgi:hypothetical protein
MHREEAEGQEICNVCGGSVLGGADPTYSFGVSGVLCWGCALERGGRYDAETETWADAPSISDLPDEEYGSSPHERRRLR